MRIFANYNHSSWEIKFSNLSQSLDKSNYFRKYSTRIMLENDSYDFVLIGTEHVAIFKQTFQF